jgi:hypothetical protein
MSELRQAKQIQTEQNMDAKDHTESCKEAAPVNANSIPLERVYKREAPRQKLLYWSGEYHHGNCTISNMRIFFWDDGRTRFESYISSTSTGDAWVFYGGISINDNHGVELWRSGKLVSPEMVWEGQSQDWDVDFFYLANWFDSIATATCNNMHC